MEMRGRERARPRTRPAEEVWTLRVRARSIEGTVPRERDGAVAKRKRLPAAPCSSLQAPLILLFFLPRGHPRTHTPFLRPSFPFPARQQMPRSAPGCVREREREKKVLSTTPSRAQRRKKELRKRTEKGRGPGRGRGPAAAKKRRTAHTHTHTPHTRAKWKAKGEERGRSRPPQPPLAHPSIFHFHALFIVFLSSRPPTKPPAAERERQRSLSSVQLLLLVRLDGAVRGRVGDAGEDEALARLVVVQERLVGLVDGAGDDDARAGGAGARAAGVGQVDAGLLGGVQDVDVV